MVPPLNERYLPERSGRSDAVRPETPDTVMLVSLVLVSWLIFWLGPNASAERGAPGPDTTGWLALSAMSSRKELPSAERPALNWSWVTKVFVAADGADAKFDADNAADDGGNNAADLTNGEIVVWFDVAPGGLLDCGGCAVAGSAGSVSLDVADSGTGSAGNAAAAAMAEGSCLARAARARRFACERE